MSFILSWKCFPSLWPPFLNIYWCVLLPFPHPESGWEDGQAVSVETTEGEGERLRAMSQGMWVVWRWEGGVSWCCLSVGAVLVGGVGVDRRAVWLLAVFARRHPLVYPVQATCLFEVTDLPRGREALNGCGEEETPKRNSSEAGNAFGWITCCTNLL